MGYESSVWGKIKMTRSAYERLEKAKVPVPRSNIEIPLVEMFDNFFYDDDTGELNVDSYGKHYELDDALNIICRTKDVDSLDPFKYSGEGAEDVSFYMVGKGFMVCVSPYDLISWIFNRTKEHQTDFKEFLVVHKLENVTPNNKIIRLDEVDMLDWITEGLKRQ